MPPQQTPLRRRSVLKALGIGALTGGVIGTGTTVARRKPDDSNPKPQQHDHHDGETVPVTVEDETVGEVTAYATTNPAGNLSSLGVHVDAGALEAFNEAEPLQEEPFDAHLHFPDETQDGDEIDLHQFTFNGFHYNPAGHPPPGIYDVPHFDFHFYMLEDSIVNTIPFGIAGYDIPDEQQPDGYFREELLIPRMGEHLLDGNAPEWDGPHEPSGTDFTHTHVYGAYDTDINPNNPGGCTETEDGETMDVFVGDNEGRLHFFEPMVTNAYIGEELDDEETVELATPERFFEADDYPTEYVMQLDGDGGVFVSLDGFEEFPGPSD